MQEAMNDTHSLESIIGPVGSPVPRLGRTQRTGLRRLLKDEAATRSLPPGILVRATVAAGQHVREALLDRSVLADSLSVVDLVRYAPRLSTLESRVNSSVVFGGIEDSLRKSPTPVSRSFARRICVNLHKWQRWLSEKEAIPSLETEVALLQLLTTLLRRIARPQKRGGLARKGSEPLLTLIISTGIPPRGGVENPALFLGFLRLMEAVRHFAGNNVFESLLNGSCGKGWLDSLVAAIPQVMQLLATEGRLEELAETSASCSSLPKITEEVRKVLDSLWRTKAGLLTEDVQHWLQSFLGISAQKRIGAIEVVDRSERPEITQLGLALLRAWDARFEGDRARQAFDTLHQVCRNFYGIRLSGDVGNRVLYDPRFHELEGGIRGTHQVALRRPWVEWRDGEKWKVIIRAVVSQE